MQQNGRGGKLFKHSSFAASEKLSPYKMLTAKNPNQTEN